METCIETLSPDDLILYIIYYPLFSYTLKHSLDIPDRKYGRAYIYSDVLVSPPTKSEQVLIREAAERPITITPGSQHHLQG